MAENFNWLAFELAKQRHKDLLLAAEIQRRARRARVGVERRYHFYGRSLAWLGRRLVTWGWRLQERHGAVSPSLTAR